jgi:molybdopterin synthase catalytic subunit
VRETNEGRAVSGLAYEAYDEMAEKELRSICEEAAERFDVGALRAIHRIGELELGAVSVVIGVAAPHRVDCYEASRYVIEELKKRLPVWKHERYVGGDAAWVGAVHAPAGDPVEETE